MPTINIPDKICSHCGGNTWVIKSDGKIDCCIHVKKEASKKYYEKVKNTENYKKKHNKYALNRYHKLKTDESFKQKVKSYRKSENSRANYKKHKVTILPKQKEYNSRPEVREQIRLNSRKRCEKLTDGYLTYVLIHNLKRTEGVYLSSNQIPQNLIQLKRKELSLKRQIKSLSTNQTPV